MPVYPGSPKDEFIPVERMKRGGNANTTLIRHFLHNGSHVDAPFHFYNGGKTIDQLPIENFIYESPLLIDRDLQEGEFIRVEDLELYGSAIFSADLLMLYTGYSKYYKNIGVYVKNFPALSAEAAKYIRKELINVKAVAIDTLSIESPTEGPQFDFKVHKILLDGELYSERPVIIYEDIDISKALGKKIKRVYAFPLRIKGLDASPVNMVLEL